MKFWTGLGNFHRAPQEVKELDHFGMSNPAKASTGRTKFFVREAHYQQADFRHDAQPLVLPGCVSTMGGRSNGFSPGKTGVLHPAHWRLSVATVCLLPSSLNIFRVRQVDTYFRHNNMETCISNTLLYRAVWTWWETVIIQQRHQCQPSELYTSNTLPWQQRNR